VTDEEERIMPNEKRRKRIVFVSVFAHNGNISKAESMLRNMGVITLLFLTLSIFWACTITPAATADQVEKMLVAADFKFIKADTPHQMDRLQGLPQRQFIRHQTDGEEYYLYAVLPDVNVCGEGTRQPTADIRNWPGNERWTTRPLSTKARMRSFYRISDGNNISEFQ
jgi:hypothetical protein